MSKQRILIIEDDKHISKLIAYNLEKAGFDCRQCMSAEEGFNVARSYVFHLLILDIMLPDMDGFEFCRKVKTEEKIKDIPIIMLTAKGEEVDRIVGLELGADDYMVKPFSPRELILRVKAILRRGQKSPVQGVTSKTENLLVCKSLRVDIERHKVTVGSRDLDLTLMEFKLLTTLLTRRGRLQTREKLLSDVWDIASDVDTRTIDTHIKRLRRKLGALGRLIETVRGMGYRFKEKE